MNRSTYIDAGAIFDEPERAYRYRLWRRWADGTLVLWIMLNPSTADEKVLDPTLRRVEAFTREWGHAGFIVVNLFAWRSKDPSVLDLVGSPVGEREGDANDEAIVSAAHDASLIVVGWGREKIAQERASEVEEILKRRTLYCLGMNQDGSPKHPLYLPATTPLVVFNKLFGDDEDDE